MYSLCKDDVPASVAFTGARAEESGLVEEPWSVLCRQLCGPALCALRSLCRSLRFQVSAHSAASAALEWRFSFSAQVSRVGPGRALRAPLNDRVF